MEQNDYLQTAFRELHGRAPTEEEMTTILQGAKEIAAGIALRIVEEGLENGGRLRFPGDESLSSNTNNVGQANWGKRIWDRISLRERRR